jgi:hypothetical protein
MPRIEEYTSRTTPAGPVGGRQLSGDDIVPGAGTVAAAGRAATAAGRQLSQVQRQAELGEAEALQNVGEGLVKVGERLSEIEAQAARQRSTARVTQSKIEDVSELKSYIFEIENGVEDEQGIKQPPADPLARKALVESRVEQIRKRRAKFFGDDRAGLLAWRNDFDQEALRQTLDVRKRAIDFHRQDEKAGLTRELDTFADAAMNADGLERVRRIEDAKVAIQNRVVNGSIDPVEAQKLTEGFQDQLATAGALRAMRGSLGDLEDFERLLLTEREQLDQEQASVFGRISPAKREQLLKQTGALIDRKLDEQDREEKRRIALGEKQKRERADAAMKDLEDLRKDPKAYSAKLAEVRDILTDNQYRAASQDLREGTRDNKVYQQKMQQARAVRTLSAADRLDDEVAGLVPTGALRLEDWKEIRNEARRAAGQDDLPTWYKYGQDSIERFLGGEQATDELSSKRQAIALDDFRRWALEHRDAPYDQAEKEWKRIQEGASVFGKGQDAPVPDVSPRFSVLKDGFLDVAATTANILAEKDLTEKQRNRELARVNRYRKTNPAAPVVR